MNNYGKKGTFYTPGTNESAPVRINPINTALKGKNIEPMDKKDAVFMLLFFAAVFIFIDFAVMNGFNLGFTIAFFILFAVVTVYFAGKKVKASVFSYICGALSLAGSVTLALYRDIFINFIMVFLAAALFTLYTCGISGTFRSREGSFKIVGDMLCSAFIAPFANVGNVTRSFGKSVSKSKGIINIIIGIGISIPVLLVVVPLLVSSDAAFEGLISAVAKNIGIYLFEIILAVIAAPYVISYMFCKKRNFKTGSEALTRDYSGARFLPDAVSVSFLSVISITYIVYLFSQLAYFFSAFSGILPEGYEYSASVYARRGFYEMFAIGIINLLIMSAVNIFTKRKNGRISGAIKAVSTFISLFTVVLLITAMSKMKLNIENFGLSKNRLLVSVFMIMMLIIIAFYILHIFLPKVNYMQAVIVVCSALFIAVSFADIDAAVARYNVEAYKDGRLETVDVSYLQELSDSAAPYIIELAADGDENIKNTAQNVISNKIHYDYSDRFEFDENGTLVYSSSFDFRKYNFIADKACRQYCDYYNSLSDEAKEEFDAEYDDAFEPFGNIYGSSDDYSYDEEYSYDEYDYDSEYDGV